MTFVQIPDSQLAEFSNGTIIGMDIPQFDGAPVNKAAMTVFQTTFVQKLAAARNGGRVEIAEKNVARTALVAALRQNANCVQLVAETDLPLLLLSGYRAVSTTRTSGPLTKPVITNVDNFQSAVLMIGAAADSRTRAQELRYRTGAGEYQSGGVHTKAKRMLLENQVPGTTVEVQTRSVGGTTGYSDWSDTVSHMAT